MRGFETDVAFLALCVLGARHRRGRYSLRALLVGMILLGAASFLDLLAELVVAALVPVLFLAFGPTVSCTAAAAFLSQG